MTPTLDDIKSDIIEDSARSLYVYTYCRTHRYSKSIKQSEFEQNALEEWEILSNKKGEKYNELISIIHFMKDLTFEELDLVIGDTSKKSCNDIQRILSNYYCSKTKNTQYQILHTIDIKKQEELNDKTWSSVQSIISSYMYYERRKRESEVKSGIKIEDEIKEVQVKCEIEVEEVKVEENIDILFAQEKDECYQDLRKIAKKLYIKNFCKMYRQIEFKDKTILEEALFRWTKLYQQKGKEYDKLMSIAVVSWE